MAALEQLVLVAPLGTASVFPPGEVSGLFSRRQHGCSNPWLLPRHSAVR